MHFARLAARVALAVLSVHCAAATANAYAVLTHEQVVDLLWDERIEPLLLKRFPGTTKATLMHARAFAYGGCVMPDLGYYPFGSHHFSNILHYVRSGDFVEALLREAADVDEYAFALGALAHYVSDTTGHPAVNRSVAIAFPKLRRRYGDEVTYAESPTAHIRTEFGFDVVQVAKGRYTSDQYHDFIGFEVSKPALERALRATYGLSLDETLSHPDLAIGSFRRAVSTLIPELTRIAAASRKTAQVAETPDVNEKRFLYVLSRADYEREWGAGYRRPGLVGRVFAFLLRLMPKVGPFKVLKIEVPSRATEDLYVESMTQTVAVYRTRLVDVRDGRLDLPNLDCDTGQPARLGEYDLADETFGRLLHDSAERHFEGMPAQLRAAILSFYRTRDADSGVKRDRKRWRRTQQELARLEERRQP